MSFGYVDLFTTFSHENAYEWYAFSLYYWGKYLYPYVFPTMRKQKFVPSSDTRTINMKVKGYYLSQFAHVATEPFPKDIRNE